MPRQMRGESGLTNGRVSCTNCLWEGLGDNFNGHFCSTYQNAIIPKDSVSPVGSNWITPGPTIKMPGSTLDTHESPENATLKNIESVEVGEIGGIMFTSNGKFKCLDCGESFGKRNELLEHNCGDDVFVDPRSPLDYITAEVAAKQESYGDSISFTSSVAKILWPKGMPVEVFPDALILLRVLDKVCRLSRGKALPDEGRKDAWKDIIGYALRALERER